MTDMNRRLYAYDNLDVLNDEIALPTESVDLIYLDPPFNSNSTYNLPFKELGHDIAAVAAFKDNWHWGTEEDEHLARLDSGPHTKLLGDIVRVAQNLTPSRRGNDLAAYLVNMAVRLLPLRRVLKDTGSVYLHCDPTAGHYLKMLMDAIFGQENFRNEVIWHYGLGGFNVKRWFPRKHDTIFYYAKSARSHHNKIRGAVSKWMEAKYRLEDEAGKYFVQDGKKYYLKGGKPVDTLWDNDELIDYTLSQTADERLGYPTQKPLALLERIISASSSEGDLVLDPFCGCGTTIHAAELLGRRWIGIDISRFSAGLVRERVQSHFHGVSGEDVAVFGLPLTLRDARALAANDKFEFEKWVCGEIGAHGMYHNPGDKGADGGVDGVIKFYPFRMGRKPEPELAIVQVKGGNVTPDSVRALYDTVDQLGATAGIFVCFADQMATVENNRNKRTFSDDAGVYPVIQGYSIESLLANEPLDLPIHRLRDDARLVP